MSARAVRALGWAATATALIMYLSYIDVIRLNLAGRPGSMVLPVATMVNASLWCGYGLFRPKIDWPLVIANAPGIVLSALAVATAL